MSKEDKISLSILKYEKEIQKKLKNLLIYIKINQAMN